MTRDIADMPAVEVITTVAVHLMSSAAVKLGLSEDGEQHRDLEEARKLIHALAGLVTASATEIGSYHAAPLRDGLKSLQLAFREALRRARTSRVRGPGEHFTRPGHGLTSRGGCPAVVRQRVASRRAGMRRCISAPAGRMREPVHQPPPARRLPVAPR